MDITKLPYRLGVGILLMNENKQIFVGQRIDTLSEAWQMPQGGIDEGEDELAAAYRELEEETSVKKSDVKLLSQSPDWLYYDLPEDLIPKVWKGKYRGQKQKWYLMQLLKSENEVINLNTKHPEFNDWRFIDLNDVPKMIVPFKQKLYKDLVKIFYKDIK